MLTILFSVRLGIVLLIFYGVSVDMLKVSLVGCGRIAKRHADLLGKGRILGAVLASVCDIDRSCAE